VGMETGFLEGKDMDIYVTVIKNIFEQFPSDLTFLFFTLKVASKKF